MREFVLFCDLAKDHCPTKKEAPGISRSFALAGFLLAFRKCHPLAIARAADPPDAASTCFRSAKRNEHSHRPVIARIARVQAAAHKSWIARRTLRSNQSGCGRRRETFDERKETNPGRSRGL